MIQMMAWGLANSLISADEPPDPLGCGDFCSCYLLADNACSFNNNEQAWAGVED